MHERKKIKEAEFFLGEMKQREPDPAAHGYMLSAFLTAARSVLQYAKEEAISRSSGQAWYDTAMAGSQVFGYFKDKRDVNIHLEPLETKANTAVAITNHISVAEVVEVVVRDPHGNVVSQTRTESPPQTRARHSETTATNSYSFDDWSGNQSVRSLCESYLSELKTLVVDGRNRGFISG